MEENGALGPETLVRVSPYERALKAIGQQVLELEAQGRAIQDIQREVRECIVELSVMRDQFNLVQRAREDACEEFAASIALIFAAMPDATGRVSQGDLEEVRAIIKAAAETSLRLHDKRHDLPE